MYVSYIQCIHRFIANQIFCNNLIDTVCTNLKLSTIVVYVIIDKMAKLISKILNIRIIGTFVILKHFNCSSVYCMSLKTPFPGKKTISIYETGDIFIIINWHKIQTENHRERRKIELIANVTPLFLNTLR